MIKGFLLISLILVSQFGCSYISLRPLKMEDKVRFTFKDNSAKSVSISGDFNGWSGDQYLQDKDGDGTWEIVMPLHPGDYEYIFIVNDVNFITPPYADDYIRDDYGNINGIIIFWGKEVDKFISRELR